MTKPIIIFEGDEQVFLMRDGDKTHNFVGPVLKIVEEPDGIYLRNEFNQTIYTLKKNHHDN